MTAHVEHEDTDRGSYVAVSLRMGSDTWVTCHAYLDTPPILSISSAGQSLSLSTCGRGPVTSGDVQNARDLLRAATSYLAECERLHAEESTGTGEVAA